jgi:hypothetical protein
MKQKANPKDKTNAGATTWSRWMKRAGQTIALGLLRGMATAAGGLVFTGLMMWVGQR